MFPFRRRDSCPKLSAGHAEVCVYLDDTWGGLWIELELELELDWIRLKFDGIGLDWIGLKPDWIGFGLVCV